MFDYNIGYNIGEKVYYSKMYDYRRILCKKLQTIDDLCRVNHQFFLTITYYE